MCLLCLSFYFCGHMETVVTTVRDLCYLCLYHLNYNETSLDVVVFMFNVPPTAKVIWRRGHSLKSHPTD